MNKLEFSADGKQLLGTFRTDGKDHGLAWFDLATGAVQPLAPVHSYTRFALSPDGKWIAHTTPPDQPGEQTGNDGSHTDLWKMPAGRREGREGVPLPGPRSTTCAGPTAAGRWSSPTELGQAHDDLWKLPLADPLRGMTKLTSGQADEDRPSVSRDGKWLVYTDNRAGPTALVVRDIGDRRGGRGPVRRDGLPPADRHAAAPGRGRGDEEARRSRGSR